MVEHRRFEKKSGRGCFDCEGKIARLAQESSPDEDSCFNYECSFCGSVWGPSLNSGSVSKVKLRRVRRSDLKLLEPQSSTKCTRCGKPICLSGTFGSFGDEEPGGLVINGAAYCWNCMEKTAKTIEGMKR
jgi:hypothetical protein